MMWKEAKVFFAANGYWYGNNHPIAVARKYRRFFLETIENCCRICCNDQWLGKPIPLVLDHINGNSSDWSMNNLRLICGNCDMTLPTYKNRNKGRGRGYRRDRYHEGKTF